MKAMANLPNYEIVSQAVNFGSLKQSDIDVNIINNLDSRYYSAHEFQGLKKENAFNILHSSLDGLENKFEQLHNFVNKTNMDMDVLCFSETSQKLNQDFITNVSITGYKQPFLTGSKFTKGGVAIYGHVHECYQKMPISTFQKNSFSQIMGLSW